MSYTIEVDATDLGKPFDPVHTCGNLHVTTFSGGDRGRMVQISTGFNDMSCLTMPQLDVLINVLNHARERSLFDHPLYGSGYDE